VTRGPAGTRHAAGAVPPSTEAVATPLAPAARPSPAGSPGHGHRGLAMGSAPGGVGSPVPIPASLSRAERFNYSQDTGGVTPYLASLQRLKLPLLSLCAASALSRSRGELLPSQPMGFYHFLLALDRKRLGGR